MTAEALAAAGLDVDVAAFAADPAAAPGRGAGPSGLVPGGRAAAEPRRRSGRPTRPGGSGQCGPRPPAASCRSSSHIREAANGRHLRDAGPLRRGSVLSTPRSGVPAVTRASASTPGRRWARRRPGAGDRRRRLRASSRARQASPCRSPSPPPTANRPPAAAESCRPYRPAVRRSPTCPEGDIHDRAGFWPAGYTKSCGIMKPPRAHPHSTRTGGACGACGRGVMWPGGAARPPRPGRRAGRRRSAWRPPSAPAGRPGPCAGCSSRRGRRRTGG